MWSMTRRMFVALPFLQRILKDAATHAPDRPSPTVHAAAQQGFTGVTGSFYASPTFEWSMEFGQTAWLVVRSTSEHGVDVLKLLGTEEGAPSALVTFETSPLGDDTPEDRLREAADALDNVFPDATIEIGRDENGDPIEDYVDLAGDQIGRYWLTAYTARHARNPSKDRIIELDSIPIRHENGVLVITSISSPGEYLDHSFDLVRELRSSIAIETWAPADTSSMRAAGGSRPRVQY